jgi:hypothetical protein
MCKDFLLEKGLLVKCSSIAEAEKEEVKTEVESEEKGGEKEEVEI